jgi:hemoglobin
MDTNRLINQKIWLVTFVYMSILSACSNLPDKNPSLFTRIGGKEKLAIISTETIDKMVASPKTKRSFEGVKLAPLKESITNFLCVKTGGDCVYEGETMKNSHADAKITTAEFELMVQALRDVLDANGVGNREKNELLRILAPMKSDIVHGGV